MIETAIGIGLIWFVWKCANRSLTNADRDCEIARLMVAKRADKATEREET